MDQQTIITSIEERAAQARISIAELCRRADVHPTTFSRWKKSEGNPTPIGATLASLSKLEEKLAEAESAMLAGDGAVGSAAAEAA